MTAVTYLLFVLMHLPFIYGSSPIIQYKCLLWDSSCLTASAQAAVPSFTSGIPELGIERLDTMFINGVNIDQDGYKAAWNNIYLQGLRNTIIDKLSIDLNSKVMRLMFHTNLSLRAHYVKQGYLLSLPVSGEGDVTMQIYSVHMEFVIPFEIIKNVQGKDVMDLKGYQYWYDVKDGVNVHFGNLYYGNNELSRKMHVLLQQNWKLITVKYGRHLFDKINDKIFNAIRNYMHSQPLDTITLY